MSTDDYLDATAEYNQASEALDTLAQRIRGYSSALEFERHRISFDSAHARGTVRVGNTVATPVILDLTAWPTGDEVKDAVDRWNEARRKVSQAWEKVPEQRRPALAPPPG